MKNDDFWPGGHFWAKNALFSQKMQKMPFRGVDFGGSKWPILGSKSRNGLFFIFSEKKSQIRNLDYRKVINVLTFITRVIKVYTLETKLNKEFFAITMKVFSFMPFNKNVSCIENSRNKSISSDCIKSAIAEI